MAPPPSSLSTRSVRVLVRTALGDLQQIDPLIEKADNTFITQLCTRLSSSIDKAAIHLLITRQLEQRVDIVFDHNLTRTEHPDVLAFRVRICDSIWTIDELFNPSIKGRVNNTVKAWKEINVIHGLSFPSRENIHLKLCQRQGAVDSGDICIKQT
jgi:hypothetical protein